MPINITMPALSPTMEEGTLAKWHVKEGDSVSSGDVIAEIETDKATMEVEAVDEGIIAKILVAEGTEGVKVNAVIAVLLEEGESADAANSVPVAKTETSVTAPAVAQVAETPSAAPVAAKPAAIPAPAAESGARVFASPLARRMAKDAGIELKSVVGTGPKGRIVKQDVVNAKTTGVAKPVASVSNAATSALSGGMGREQVISLYEEGTYDLVQADGMRKVVAARLTESKQSVPHFYLSMDCKIDALMKAREDINAAAPKSKEGKPEYKLSVNDFVMKAWALALQKVPMANATWAGDAILYHHRSDVAVAVSVNGGLFTPVVRSCDTKTLRQISDDVKDLAGRARNKKLAPHEYQGGSSSVSNLGMFGVSNFQAVINPPHGTILAVGAGEERVYAEKGQMKIGQFMTVTLSCDHRAVDGALGAELLATFKALIENPIMMLA